MASRIAEAYVQITPRIDGVAAGLNAQLSSELGASGAVAGTAMATGVSTGFGSKIQGLLKPALIGAGLLATAAVGNFLKDSVGAASDFAEQGAAVGQVFGTAAGTIQDFAAGAATALGQSKNQVLEASKQFGIYGNAAGLAGEDNAKFSTDLVTLATDLASFNNTSVDDALMALGSGLRGEAEPLRKFGILLDDATLKAAYFAATGEEVTGALTPQQKIIAANASIMEQSSIQQGDFARTSDGLANQQRILDANMANLGITIGTSLLPIVNNITTFINDHMVPAFDSFIAFFRDNGTVIGVFVGVLGGLLAIIYAVQIATGIWSVVQGILNAVMALNPFVLIAILIAALIAGIVYLATETTFFQDVWEAMTGFVTAAWDAVVAFFSDTFTAIGNWFTEYLIDPIVNAWESFLGFFGTAVESIGGFFTDVFNGITDFFKMVVNGWIIIFENFINFFINGINGLLGPLNLILEGIKIATNGAIDLRVGTIPNVKLPRLAEGGFVDQPTTALIGEAGPEVVMPLNRFEQLMGLNSGGRGNGQTINYYAAPNKSLDAEQALLQAMQRTRVLTSW
jgi:hypothetical protein